MKKIVVILILLCSSISATEAILQLDTGGHTALIWDVVATKSGDIVTASDDKTIRVWDSKRGKEKRKILGQIGKGSEGKIYAIALSPDEKQLAVGGYGFIKGDQKTISKGKSGGEIKIYNYKTGKLIKNLISHSLAVLDLSYSPDSKYLISGSGDFTAKIWDANSLSLEDTITHHTKEVYAVKIVKDKNRYLAITAGLDNQIAIYDLKKRKTVKKKRLDYKLKYLATTNKHIALCGFDKEILIYDYNLNLIKKINSKTEPSGLSYSPNGKLSIAGTGAYPYNINIYNPEQNYTLTNTFQKHKNLTQAVTFLNNTMAVTAGGSNNEIYIWSSKSTKTERKIEGAGAIVWSVGVRGDEIGWGNRWTANYGKSSLQKTINLKTFRVGLALPNNKLKRIATTKGKLTLTHTGGGDYGYSDGVLILKRDQKEIARVTRGSTNGYRHNCYGFYKNHIISGGSNGHLKIYNQKGIEIANLIGHTGEIWSIALDGDRLVSGSSDQTIKIWNLHHIETEKEIYPLLSLFVSKDDEYVIWSQSGYYASSAGGDKYVGYHINQGVDKEARYVGSDKYFDTLYRPDIIQLILDTGSQKKAIAFADQKRKVRQVDIASSLPPVVSLLSASHIKTDKNNITIEYSVESKEPIRKTVIVLNGKQLNTRSIVRKKNQTKTVIVDLEDGENIISIKAKNKFALSDEILVYANKTSQTADIYKPTLYLLSIGVSQYKNPEYNLGVADKDAESIARMFQKQSGKLYKEVVVKTLVNREADSDNILDGLTWIDREATSKDVVIIFIAGHGINDDKGNYYFLSYEANLDRLRRTAVKWTEIQDTIDNLPSKIILLADTCHSGNIAGIRRDITSAVKSIINSGTGSIIMTATTGSGYSYEQPGWGHGAFTKALLEGIDHTKADYDKDQSVSIKEIDLYVTSRVKELTKGRQKPTTIVPRSIPDFAVGVK
ncbi:MAG: caspase family protein [Campylobacterota bacterium]|nr:caspase family protein [Campylobacterota bacterium]